MFSNCYVIRLISTIYVTLRSIKNGGKPGRYIIPQYNVVPCPSLVNSPVKDYIEDSLVPFFFCISSFVFYESAYDCSISLYYIFKSLLLVILNRDDGFQIEPDRVILHHLDTEKQQVVERETLVLHIFLENTSLLS